MKALLEKNPVNWTAVAMTCERFIQGGFLDPDFQKEILDLKFRKGSFSSVGGTLLLKKRGEA